MHVHGRHGPLLRSDGTAVFRVWAPHAAAVTLELEGRSVTLTAAKGGWFHGAAPAGHGTRYAFRLDGGSPRPDPASRWQPDGVHAASAVVDPATFQWSPEHQRWRGTPMAGAVLYELHVGTFTAAGTFAAACEYLAGLADLGVTHVEVMPVGAFDGRFGWGYDGVLWRAVHQPYGGPEEAPRAFAAFVDACHRHGLAVVLDVVLNHLGPSGNYLGDFGSYLRDDRGSPWGQALNLDGPGSGPVRSYLLETALGWFAEYGVDALRLDAVHALIDTSATPVLAELARRTASLGAQLGRSLALMAESDREDPATVLPVEAGGLGLDAVWADDLHHAIRTAITPEREGYYADYRGLDDVAAAYRRGFVFEGTRPSAFRGASPGAPVPDVIPGWRFIGCIENHDQVGNRALGERLEALAAPDLVRIAIVLLLASPTTPLLWMGQEYDERRPFLFFADVDDPDLARATRDGRREEFAAFAGFAGDEIPDPTDPATHAASVLDRSRAATVDASARRALWQDLLALRRAQPALGGGRRDLVVSHRVDADVLIVERRAPDAAAVLLTVNLGREPLREPMLAGWEALLSSADPRYGGDGGAAGEVPARAAVLWRQTAPD